MTQSLTGCSDPFLRLVFPPFQISNLPNAALLKEHLYGKVIAYPRGKTTGGSSAINILGLVYPSKSSINNWGKLGNDDWSQTFYARPMWRKRRLVLTTSMTASKDMMVMCTAPIPSLSIR